MILNKFDKYERLGFFERYWFQHIGIRLIENKFNFFDNCKGEFYSNDNLQLKEFFIDVKNNQYFIHRFSGKKYFCRGIYDI